MYVTIILAELLYFARELLLCEPVLFQINIVVAYNNTMW